MVKTKSKDKLSLLDDFPLPMSISQLPTCKDVLCDYYFQKQELSENTPFNELKNLTIDKVIDLYKKVPQVTVTKERANNKLKGFLNDYSNAKKYDKKSPKVKSFLGKLQTLFDISSCKCPMQKKFTKGTMICSCKPENKILETEFEFMSDQRGTRLMHLSPEVDDQLTEQYVATHERRQTVKGKIAYLIHNY